MDDVIFYALTIAATLAVAYLIVRIISGLVGRLESSRRIRIHVAALFRTLASAVVYAGAVLALLYMFIVSLEVILLVVGAFVIAFIIMSRDILTNVAAYYALAISVPSKRGDFVEVGAVKGRVLRRNMLFTEIRSEEGRTIDVPNVVFLRNPTTVHLGRSL
ncbi:MAG: mechanosensitive ion channel domain-containing protein, partial [Candidatus Bathyarchaeia archaeon]